MPFTDTELAEHLQVLEDSFWSHRRPPLHLRDQVREGQRIQGRTIELFLMRPLFKKPGEWIEESIAKLECTVSKGSWHLFCKRGNGRWTRYQPFPDAPSLAEALRVIDEDARGFFFG